jgi:hypothetical protein
MSIALLINLIIVLIVLGLLLWCIQRIPGLPAPIPVVLQILVVLVFALYLLGYATDTPLIRTH